MIQDVSCAVTRDNPVGSTLVKECGCICTAHCEHVYRLATGDRYGIGDSGNPTVGIRYVLLIEDIGLDAAACDIASGSCICRTEIIRNRYISAGFGGECQN